MSLNYTTEAVTTYGGPYPAEGSGAHRYTILLLPQPASFQAPADLSTPGVRAPLFSARATSLLAWTTTTTAGTDTPLAIPWPQIAISTMNFPDYIATTGLEAPVAGWYMQVEQGTSTVSAAETSAVQSSTLPAFGASSCVPSPPFLLLSLPSPFGARLN